MLKLLLAIISVEMKCKITKNKLQSVISMHVSYTQQKYQKCIRIYVVLWILLNFFTLGMQV